MSPLEEARELIGSYIVDARYATNDEMDLVGFDRSPCPIVLVTRHPRRERELRVVMPLRDDEANGPGALITMSVEVAE